MYKLYANASNGECPIQIGTSTPSCGHSRFGCWTCTVVDRDKASEGLLAAGDERMEHLLAFRETLMEFRDPANGWRDSRRMNGNDGPGPLLITGRRELLKRLLQLQEETGLSLITPEELLLIQQMWKAARDPDDGRGVARIVNKQRGIISVHKFKEPFLDGSFLIFTATLCATSLGFFAEDTKMALPKTARVILCGLIVSLILGTGGFTALVMIKELATKAPSPGIVIGVSLGILLIATWFNLNLAAVRIVGANEDLKAELTEEPRKMAAEAKKASEVNGVKLWTILYPLQKLEMATWSFP